MPTKLKGMRKKDTYLPIEQAVLVPSTIHNRPISMAQRRKRINEVKKYLSNSFGGFTSVSAHGGFYSGQLKKVIQEPVTVVTSFGTSQAYKKNRTKLVKQIRKWGKRWHQESMGYEREGDLYYLAS